MKRNFYLGVCSLATCLALGLSVSGAATSENLLTWNKDQDRVDADVRGLGLADLLERVAAQTGWQIYVEPAASCTASVKFRQLSSGEALRRLLGDLNFALVPQTNASPRLYVFRTAMHNATRLVRATPGKTAGKPKRVPNELIVRLKPGANIESWARLLGAKVTGRIPELNAYRLEFPDAAAADAAMQQFTNNPDVAAVDYNYYFEQPQPALAALAASSSPLSLKLKPPGDSGRVVVGLVDAGVQPLGGDLDKFLLKSIAVAGDSQLDGGTPTHGTSMAETILRSLEIVTKGNTSVQILPVDVYGPNAETTTWNVAMGILAAVNGGANVVNLSLGGAGDSSVLRDLIKSVSDRGIPIFAAAGNEPVSTAFYPAAYPEVIAVTAVDQGKIADYANFGSFVDVAAPDSSIVYYRNQPWYVRGTSASAAYTSGMAAGLADTTHRNWADIRNIILHNLPVPVAK